MVNCFALQLKEKFLVKVYEIPVASRTSKGRPLVNMLKLDDDETVTQILPVDEFSEINLFWQPEMES